MTSNNEIDDSLIMISDIPHSVNTIEKDETNEKSNSSLMILDVTKSDQLIMQML
jgi:hypothetical protein